MALAFGSAGAASAPGTTSLSVPYPSGISAGDLLVLCTVNKVPPNAPTTPTGWTLSGQGLGGGGSTGANSGNTYASVYTKVADGSESGSLTLSIPSGNSAGARMIRYTGSGSYVFAEVDGNYDGWDTGPDVALAPTATNGPLDLTVGDIVLIVYGSNSARADFPSSTLTESGITFGSPTVRTPGTTSPPDRFAIGNNTSLYVAERTVTAGTANASPWATIQTTFGAAADPEGGGLIFRIREAAGGTNFAGSAALSATSTLASTATVALAGSASLSASSTLAAAATLTCAGSAALAAASTLAASGSLVASAAASLGATSTLTASAALEAAGEAALSAGGSLVASGALAAQGSAAALSAMSTLTASAGSSTQYVGSASMAANSSLSASAGARLAGAAHLAATASLAAEADILFACAAELAAGGTFTAQAHCAYTGSAVLSASCTLTATYMQAEQTVGGTSTMADIVYADTMADIVYADTIADIVYADTIAELLP